MPFSVLIHNFPHCGATCIRWPSWKNYVFNHCCSLLSLSNILWRSSQFLKMDYPNLWWPQWRKAVFQPVICNCMFLGGLF